MKLPDFLAAKKYVLCFIRDNVAYFTSLPIEDQHGEDWQKRPYHCNAYLPDSKEAGQIVEIPFETLLVKPEDTCHGDHLSVYDINDGLHPWLQGQHEAESVSIYAGETIQEFFDKIYKTKGRCWVPADWLNQEVVDSSVQEAMEATKALMRAIRDLKSKVV